MRSVGIHEYSPIGEPGDRCKHCWLRDGDCTGSPAWTVDRDEGRYLHSAANVELRATTDDEGSAAWVGEEDYYRVQARADVAERRLGIAWSILTEQSAEQGRACGRVERVPATHHGGDHMNVRWQIRRRWWRIARHLPTQLRGCRCRSYHGRTGTHTDGCPRRRTGRFAWLIEQHHAATRTRPRPRQTRTVDVGRNTVNRVAVACAVLAATFLVCGAQHGIMRYYGMSFALRFLMVQPTAIIGASLAIKSVTP